MNPGKEDRKNGTPNETPSKRRKTEPRAFVSLDELDLAILRRLQSDPRVRSAELGRQVGLSAPAVTERLHRLEEGGVVSYRAEVDPRALGYTILAIVRVSPAGRDLRRIAEIARESPEVTQCQRITGEDCFFMTLHLQTIDDLEEVLDRFTPFGRTTTSIVHSEPVPRRGLPL